MELGGNSSTGIIDQRQDNTDDSFAMVDANALAFAAAFNAVAFPPDMPESTRAAILDRAEQIRNTSGDFIRDNQIGPRSERERQKRDEADNTDNLSLLAQIAQQQQAERDQWAQTRSTVGGVTMTGAEWSDFAKRLRGDSKLRQEMLELFIQRGMTRDQAERRYDRIQAIAEAASVPPSQRNDEQKRVIAEANTDPTIKDDLLKANNLRQSLDAPERRTNQFNAASDNQSPAAEISPRPTSPASTTGLVATVSPDAAF